MRQAGVTDYIEFAKEAVELVSGRPLSLEVFSDDPGTMRKEALRLAQLGANVNVKIPITNTEGESCMNLVRDLSSEGVKVNVTAVFTYKQIEEAVNAVMSGPAAYVSVFAGRIADAGVDPLPTMQFALSLLKGTNAELIWASPREVLNVVQAADIGCHVITVTHDLIKKFSSLGKDLGEFSLDTVRMFARDAAQARYSIV
jgi:transaldolase